MSTSINQANAKLGIDILTTLRGVTSRGELSRRLGFNYNIVSRWESGKAAISWENFTQVCNACDANIRTTLKEIIGFGSSPDDSTALVRHLLLGLPIGKVAVQMGCTSLRIWRLSSGTQAPSLNDILSLIDLNRGVMPLFIERLVGTEKATFIYPRVETIRGYQRAIYENPALIAVLCSLDLAEYKALNTHVDGFIAQRVGISLEEERHALKALIGISAIRREGDKYVPLADGVLDFRSDLAGFIDVVNYWLGRGQTQLIHSKQRNLMAGIDVAFHVASISEQGWKRVKAAMLAYYNTVIEEIENDEAAKSRVVSFATFLMNTAEP